MNTPIEDPYVLLDTRTLKVSRDPLLANEQDVPEEKKVVIPRDWSSINPYYRSDLKVGAPLKDNVFKSLLKGINRSNKRESFEVAYNNLLEALRQPGFGFESYFLETQTFLRRRLRNLGEVSGGLEISYMPRDLITLFDLENFYGVSEF